MSTFSKKLIERVQADDGAALEELLVESLPGLYAWIRLRVGPVLRARESLEDLVQSIARDALGDLDAFEWQGEPAFRHWLYTRAQRKIVDKARIASAKKRDPKREERLQRESGDFLLDAGMLTPSQDLSSKEELARIERAFQAMPDNYREAVSMRRLCGMSYEQIAEAMHVPTDSVRNLVHRGLSRLAILLEQDS
jgi:RNA polymerase sigma-70 factor, ECF subfamily